MAKLGVSAIRTNCQDLRPEVYGVEKMEIVTDYSEVVIETRLHTPRKGTPASCCVSACKKALPHYKILLYNIWRGGAAAGEGNCGWHPLAFAILKKEGSSDGHDFGY